MKHTIKITAIILLMFLVTQFIGLAVINAYSPKTETIYNPQTGETENITSKNPLPYGFEPPEMEEQKDFWTMLPNIIISLVLAIVVLFLLIKYKVKFILRTWFFIVVCLALALAFNALLKSFTEYAWLIALIIAIPLGAIKIYRPTIIIHNLTELLIYPGISAVFVPILNPWTAIIFLVIISIYDIWAVWHSGIMQKMAKFQMNELKVFGGFFVPYMTKKVRAQIQKLKLSKSKKAKNKKIKVSLAILGGGDVVFPIITAGVFLRTYGFLSALFIIFGAFAGLLYLLSISEKKKFYPAMPFITAGILLGILASYLFYLIL